MADPVRLAVGAEQALALESGLLERPDRRLVVCCGFREHAAEPELAQSPGRPESQSLRGDLATSCFREHRDRDAGDLLVLVELEVEEPERAIARCICDHERRRTA